MDYTRFATYNVTGGLLWVFLFVMAGFAFGNVPVVKENLTLIILGIIFASVLPPIVGMLRQRMQRSRVSPLP